MNCTSRILWLVAVSGALLGALVAPSTGAETDNELARGTWQIPDQEQVYQQVNAWLGTLVNSQSIEEHQHQEVLARWSKPIPESQRLTALAETFAQVDSDAKPLVEFCRDTHSPLAIPEFSILHDSTRPPFVRQHLRLHFARWLIQHKLYNEVIDTIGDLVPDDVVCPADLLFYQAVAYHRLLRKEQCLPIVDRLLEQESKLPLRFSNVSKLMKADIAPLERDSLDEVSRLMDSIKIRLGHARAGTRVRKEEDDVIAKLDKMIHQLEEQAQNSQGSGGASSGRADGNATPSNPMQDSMPGGVKGPGNVDLKKLQEQPGWGNLPPKEREQALQELGKEFPSHYREVIEEYFRRIAREGTDR